MSASTNIESGQGRTEGEILGGNSKGIASNKVAGTYTRNMQVYGYTSVTCILIGLLIFVGWLYKKDKVSNTDTILMFILGQVLGLWVALTNKIFRIYGSNQPK